MATVTVELPSLLAQLLNGRAKLKVEADTLAGALRALVAEHTIIGHHVFDEHGDLRRHVLCFHNDTNTRWLDSTEVPVKDGDTITIMQAVSGG